MNKQKIFILLTSGLVAISCRNERLHEPPNEEITEIISNAEVKNGRLFFANKSSLQFHYEKLKDADEKEISNYVDSKDYLPLRPILTEKNEKIMEKKLSLRISKLKEKAKHSQSSKLSNYLKTTNNENIIDDIDDIEEIIGDDTYGAFLNNDAEIQVGNKIYKYTDVGLFIVNEDKYHTLNPYLESKNISTDLLVSTDKDVKLEFLKLHHSCDDRINDLIVMPSSEIEYFNSLDCRGNGEYYGGGGTTYTPPINNSDYMNDYINKLQNCSPKNGLFDGIFGDSDICIDHYEKRYRVKTKAYNYNYYLVYNLGVKVKHQYKGWTGLWRKDNCDEIRLGVLSSQFFYDYTRYFEYPKTKYGITTIYNNQNRLMFDANTHWSQNGLSITGYSIENFPKILKDDIVIEQFSNNQYINQAIQAGNNQLTADKLNEHFWKNVIPNLGNWWKNLGKPIPEANNITYAYKAPEYGKVLIYKTFYKKALNDDKLENSFDWGFQVSFNINPDNGNISPDLSGGSLTKPKEFRVLMYGIAKRNGIWHGSKINTINN